MFVQGINKFNLKRFEKELKHKLGNKSSGYQTEETVLIKSFKYFDLENNGISFKLNLGQCSKNSFVKTISKLGVTGFNEKALLEVFDIYDTNKNGTLDYKEFCGGIYSNKSFNKNITQSLATEDNSCTNTSSKVRINFDNKE